MRKEFKIMGIKLGYTYGMSQELSFLSLGKTSRHSHPSANLISNHFGCNVNPVNKGYQWIKLCHIFFDYFIFLLNVLTI
jgi:hypothetical protein